MKPVHIQISDLFFAILAVFLIETASYLINARTTMNSLLILGFSRLTETLFFIYLLFLRSSKSLVVPTLKRFRFAFGLCVLMVLAGSCLKLFFPEHLNPAVSVPFSADIPAPWVFLIVCLLAPLAEEIFFRGVIFGFFRRWGFAPALIISSLAFSTIHSPGADLPLIPLIGGVLCTSVYEFDDTLLSPFLVHATGNYLLFFILGAPV
ncbi:CPBP family intramembrane metalloprotease [bacterium]|nr:CPBP family intramembrane metalloprotease [bacterium]